jgi:hypothetical protein
MRLKRRSRCIERLCRPAEVARDERDLGIRDNTPSAGQSLFRTEAARSISQESLCSNEIAKLCHGDAPERECRCVVAKGDSLQCSKQITCRECMCRRCVQRIRRNPATLVTPIVLISSAMFIS